MTKAWRSLLFVPATEERFITKAHTRGADAIILDLEDSIPPAQKPAARAALAGAAPRVGQGGAEVVVRVNRPLELALPDIDAAIAAGATALMLPKIMGPEHVKLLAEVATASEAAHGKPVGHTRFIALVETAAALPHLFAVAAAHPRMAAMSIGIEDLATEFGALPSADAMYVWAVHCVAASRAAGILPMGALGALARIDDLDGYREALVRARGLGFRTAACIHPAHVPLINEVYGASAAERDRAKRLIAAFEDAVAKGLGAVAFEGEMIDLPIVERARKLLA